MFALRRSFAVATPKRAVAAQFQCAHFSDSFSDKERAAEQVFFNKEDEKALRKLLKKLKGQADKSDSKGLKDHIKHDTQGLENIPGLNLSKEQVDALLKWKHDH